MKLQRVALVATFSLIAGVTGYGVSYAAGGGANPTVPHAPPLPAGAMQNLAGPGASPRPPARPDSTYVPVTNCRLVNTSLAGGPIAAGTNRAFYVTGSTGFAAQGGASTGCGIPANATAISARVTATSATIGGSFATYPTGTPVSLATLYYGKGTVTTGATLELGAGAGQVLTVANKTGNAQLTLDVNGYYEEQMEGMISPSGAIYSGSNRIVSAQVLGAGNYRVTFDTDVSYCTPHITTYSGQGVYGSAYAFSGTDVYVYTWYISQTTHLETPNSYYFYITVTC